MQIATAANRWQQQSLPALPTLLLAVLVAIAYLNALMFAMQAVNPLIVSDNWHFIEVLIRKAAGGDITVSDLFYKRGALDHSQPLRKLILLFHYRYFGLDFSVETVIALAAALLNLVLLWFVVRGTRVAGRADGWPGALLFSALAAVYLSLNSSMVFSWSLVTLNYTSHLFLLLLGIAAWACLEGASVARQLLLLAATFIAGVVADDTTAVAMVAIAITSVLYSVRRGVPLRSLRIIGIALAGFACYSLLYSLMSDSPAPGAGAASMGNRVAGLLANLQDLWRWIAIPLTSSVAHRSQLSGAFGAAGENVGFGIAILVLAAHAWFWWCAFRGRVNLTAFLASNLMLLFYGLVLGTVLARVTTFGSDYLWQPRYSLIYQWNIVALLLMALAQFGISSQRVQGHADLDNRRVPGVGTVGRAVATVAGCLLLAIQIPLSAASWDSLKYLGQYEQRMAFQLGALGHDPSTTPASCAPTLVVCRMQPERRARLVRFLMVNRLNLFSPSFQARHHLYPNEEAMPR